MIEAIMFWNEPNGTYWAADNDPEWQTYLAMTRLGAAAVGSENSRLPRVAGGFPAGDASLIQHRIQALGEGVEVLAVHGFPLDWNHWGIDEWPLRLREIQAVTDRKVWVTATGASSFGAEEVQEFGLQRTAELLLTRVERTFWFSLYDPPRPWPDTTRPRDAENSASHRHFHTGLLREDGTPKRALRHFPEYARQLGICQWFDFRDPRLNDAVKWLRRLGIKYLRTGLNWADSFRPDALDWFDQQMKAIEDFEVTLTYCYNPETRTGKPTSAQAAKRPEEFAQFCANMTRRYAGCTAGSHPLVRPTALSSLRNGERNSHALRRVTAQPHDPDPPPNTLIVAAHPDDEVVGAATRLPRLRTATLIHVTDGAPREMSDALKAGFSTRRDYASVRWNELETALRIAGLDPSAARCLNIVDQEASLHLAQLARGLAEIMTESSAEVVITHPYEGGHPDHDATAFAVRAACRLLEDECITPPVIIEMACYHGATGVMTTSEFLPHAGRPVVTLELTAEQRAFKRSLFDCYVTQRTVLRNFSVDREQFRVAPDYDFAIAPHRGRLFYEFFEWGMTGSRWRALAREALEELNLVTHASRKSGTSPESRNADAQCSHY